MECGLALTFFQRSRAYQWHSLVLTPISEEAEAFVPALRLSFAFVRSGTGRDDEYHYP